MTTRRAVARIILSVLIVAAFAVLVGLGTWQLQRLAWKEALIEAATARPLAAPAAAPGPGAWPTLAIDDWTYRRVALTGTFGEGEAHAWTVLSDPKGGPEGGSGYFIVAPFTTADGWSVLVNRGFVPAALKAPSSRPASAVPREAVTIEAIIRPDDPPNFVTPAPNTETNEWFSRHIGPMATFLSLPQSTTAPYSLDLVAAQTPPSGLPQAGESQVTFSNNHLGYAFTWFGLAAALVVIVIVSLVRRRAKSS